MKIHSNIPFRNHSTTFDLRFHPSPFDSLQTELIGVVKVEGGIKYLVSQYRIINSDHVLKEIHERGFFSARPYQLGQACDGSITVCVLALFYRFCQEGGKLPNQFLRAAFPTQDIRPHWPDVLATAEWQGVAYPAKWDAGACAGLVKSLHEINYHALAGIISALTEGGTL
jgi:hypothetical protein